ncbi:MAG: hypothetical protein MUO77_20140 [Anaerolineales bacterium]|nr:hypothetical protein [Anaerolineales bacterium]
MSIWAAFDDGRSIGKVSSEGFVILRDDEHEQGARITLKHGASHSSISCNIYGKMDHTRFFKTILDAEREFNPMKMELGKIVSKIKETKDQIQMWIDISEFVRRFE